MNEMNPKLLLSYACERTVLPGGARMFKHFATSLESQHLFVYIFWFIHCKFFQVRLITHTNEMKEVRPSLVCVIAANSRRMPGTLPFARSTTDRAHSNDGAVLRQ